MKILKISLSILLGIVLLLIIIASLLPSRILIERSVEINRPVNEVYGQVADFKNWIKWNPWTEMEPTAKNYFSEPSYGIGASWSWEGDEIGTGNLKMEEYKQNEYVRSRLTFIKPFQSVAVDEWRFESTENSTEVTWTNDMELSFPVGRLSGPLVREEIEKAFDKGLSNLKKLVEEQAPIAGKQ